MDPAVDHGGAPRLFGGFGVDTLLAGALLLAGSILFLKLAVEPYAYSVYLTVHVVAAVVWVGGAFTLTTLGIVFERRTDRETLAALGRAGSWIGSRVYTPSVFVVFAFGAAMMHEAQLDWGQFWVVFGLAGWAVSAVAGIGLIGPQVGRIERVVGEHGPESAEARRHVGRLYAILRLDAALLLLIVVDMTTKPFA